LGRHRFQDVNLLFQETLYGVNATKVLGNAEQVVTVERPHRCVDFVQ
jgi:hypothetical protein